MIRGVVAPPITSVVPKVPLWPLEIRLGIEGSIRIFSPASVIGALLLGGTGIQNLDVDGTKDIEHRPSTDLQISGPSI